MIAPMKKATLIFDKSCRCKMFEALQNCGEMMFTQPYVPVTDNSAEQQTAERCLQLLDKLKPYQKNSLSNKIPEINAEEFNRFDTSNIGQLNEISEMFSELDTEQTNISNFNSMLSSLEKWKNLPLPLDMLSNSIYTKTVIGHAFRSEFDKIYNDILKLDVDVEISDKDKSETYFSVTYMNDDKDTVEELLDKIGFVNETLPAMSGTAAENISDLNSKIERASSRIDDINNKLRESYDSYVSYLSVLYEKCKSNAAISSIPYEEKDEKIHIHGWIRADREDKLRNTLNEVTQSYSLSVREPSENDTPPTAISNNRFVSQFEGITNMFSAPSSKELDPNPFMAWWYWLIFGMMMGDAGYGLLLAIFVLIGKKLLKPAGETLRLMNVFLFSSVTTIIFGILFGSYFGETINPIFISPVEQPIDMLIFTMIVGVLHIFTGLFVEILENIRHKRFLDAIFDQFSWILLISGIGLLFLENTRQTGAVLAIIGVAIIFLTAGRKSKGFFGKIAGGFAGLYGITGYLSDVLSYSRIFALGLATGIIGMVVNMLAGLVQGSIAGFAVSVVIYIIGHVINLALGLLSAYVHDCRLQYIEFYGKFYEGGGILFKPFSHDVKYIKLK